MIKYQEQGIPNTGNSKFIMWQIFGNCLFIPMWIIIALVYIALVLSVWAFIHSRNNRLQIEKSQRIRISGLKIFIMMLIIAIFAQLGEAVIQLIKGVRYPWFIHVQEYLWLTAIWVVAGIWAVLQITHKWKFSPDPYVYTKRALIVLFIYTVGCIFLGTRLAFYPAMSLLIVNLIILIPTKSIKTILAFLAPIPLFKLMFLEAFTFIVRSISQGGIGLNTFWKSLIFSSALMLLMTLWYLPYAIIYSYLVVKIKLIKNILKLIRKPVVGIIILLVIIGYSIYIFPLPSYNDLWKPMIKISAKYNIQKQESELKLRGNEYFHNVTVITDSLNKTYNERIHQVELPDSFKAEWVNVSGLESVQPGEKDTVTIDWILKSEKPWYVAQLDIKVDTLEIDTVYCETEYLHKGNKLSFCWYADPPESLQVNARFVVESGASIERKVRAIYSEMPVPVKVEADMYRLLYRTEVNWIDTLLVK